VWVGHALSHPLRQSQSDDYVHNVAPRLLELRPLLENDGGPCSLLYFYIPNYHSQQKEPKRGGARDVHVRSFSLAARVHCLVYHIFQRQTERDGMQCTHLHCSWSQTLAHNASPPNLSCHAYLMNLSEGSKVTCMCACGLQAWTLASNY